MRLDSNVNLYSILWSLNIKWFKDLKTLQILFILQTDITDYVERGNITPIENVRYWK